LIPVAMRRRSALALVVFLGGCAWISALAPRSFVLPRFDAEDVFANKPTTTFHITTPDSARRAPGVVIGEVRTHGIRAGETFFEVARYYDVGYNEIVEANPGVDPLVPPVGTRVVVPTQWILPCCTYRGTVMNVSEMRCYFYPYRRVRPTTRSAATASSCRSQRSASTAPTSRGGSACR